MRNLSEFQVQSLWALEFLVIWDLFCASKWARVGRERGVEAALFAGSASARIKWGEEVLFEYVIQ